MRIAGGLFAESAHGDAEIKRLRDDATQASGSLSPDLRVFGDALAGALDRQRRIASDLGNLLAYVDYHTEMTDVSPRPFERAGSDPFSDNAPRGTNLKSPPPFSTYGQGSPNHMAISAASDFEARGREIRADESTAAIHSEAAVSGCS
jgi:hypothetical protein